ncbi:MULTISPECIES: hypothetical protein [unclassified Leptolyngbya]|uniref:Spy/CpxP family protein refolding chaperone n=1 Tax=unclassified Leptolyngbya TaxID=2650499 RepID=UPI001689040A|nr:MULTISPECIES: hypothetical protein [unclassified Leptolyngbya]MBD1911322.1 hypothetical protein [Leptolyngbya sp. FACHB-8]MBD2156660.1 hypothetical protein [Leptolyngbya sp. FACHB-16]
MNRKWMMTAVMGGVSALALAIAPLMADAQTRTAQNQTPPAQGQAQPGSRGNGPGRGGMMQPPFELTDAQKEQMQQIRRETREQIANVFTAEQRQNFQEGVESGEPFPMVIQSLGLSDEQHEQLRTIMQNSMEQRRNVLTDEQRAQLQEHGPGRGGPQSGGSQGGGMMPPGGGNGMMPPGGGPGGM